MTKKFVILTIAAAFVCVQATPSFAANPDTGPGCGLGKLIWSDYKGQKQIAPQVLMATTNGTGMNTFGISTGTSGCTNDGTVMSSEKTNVFVALNFENLTQEMAQGQGEHLSSLATLMGVPAEHHAAFFAIAQEHYTAFVDSGETTPVAVVKALNEAVAAHPVLAKVSMNR
jgi:Protein of unknown function (DUF3015).